VGGYSFGGFVAYEIARLAREKGRAAPFVGMLGVGAPATALPGVAESCKFAVEYWESFQRLVHNTVQAERAAGAAMPDPDAALASLTPMQRVTLASTLAQAKYIPARREGDVDVFLTPEQRVLSQADPRLGFGALVTGQVRTHELKCNHLAMFEEPHVSELAEALSRRLEEEEARLS
jgi:thioesterase domain-containing protein